VTVLHSYADDTLACTKSTTECVRVGVSKILQLLAAVEQILPINHR